MQIECSESMAPHIQKIFAGEYNLPFEMEAPRILDIGANVGGFALWAIERWQRPTIETYEPYVCNFALLVKNTNAFPGITNHNLAVAEFTGKAFLHLGLNNNGECSLLDLGEQSNVGEDVQTISAATLPPCDILKCDCEGYELPILQLYEHPVKALMVEWHRVEDRYLIGELCLRRGMRLYSDEQWRTNRGIQKWLG